MKLNKHKLALFTLSLLAMPVMMLMKKDLVTPVGAQTVLLPEFTITRPTEVALNDPNGIQFSISGKNLGTEKVEITVVDHKNLVQNDWTYNPDAQKENLPQYEWQKLTFHNGGLNGNLFASTKFTPQKTGDYTISVHYKVGSFEKDETVTTKVVESVGGSTIIAPAFTASASRFTTMPYGYIELRGLNLPQGKKVEVVFKYSPKMAHLGNYSTPLAQYEHLAGYKWEKYSFHGGADTLGKVVATSYYKMNTDEAVNVDVKVYLDWATTPVYEKTLSL